MKTFTEYTNQIIEDSYSRDDIDAAKSEDRQHPRWNTDIGGSPMNNSTVRHEYMGFKFGRPAFGLTERHQGLTFLHDAHFMERLNNIGEDRNNLTGDKIRGIKNSIATEIHKKGLLNSRYDKTPVVFVSKSTGVKIPSMIWKSGVVHMATLLAPRMHLRDTDVKHMVESFGDSPEEIEIK